MADKTYNVRQVGAAERDAVRGSGATERSNRVVRARTPRAADSGGAPSGGTSMRTSASDAAKVKAEQDALMRRLNAQSTDSNN